MAASTYFAQVQQLYIAYFGRPADPTGQKYWAKNIDAANGSIASVIAGFSASAESAALFGNKSSIDKVTAIYQNAFGRAPEPAGLAYWVAQLDSGKVSQAQASWTIQQSAGPGDAAAVQNKLTAAQAFTAQIDTTAEIQGYQGSAAAESARAFLKTVTADNATATAAVNGAAAAVAAATSVGVVGTTFTLTTGVDNLVGDGGNNVFIGDFASTSAADQVNGGAGTDTFKLFTAANAVANLTLPQLTSVENLYVNGSAVAAANVAGVAGLTSVEFDGQGVNLALTLAGTQTAKFSNNNGAAVVKETLIYGATDAAASVVLNGVGKVAGAATVDVQGAALATLNLSSTGTAANNISLTNSAGAKLATLNISGSTAVTVADALAGLKTINASTATGNVTIDQSTIAADNQLTFTGGAGNDKVIFAVGNLTAGATGDVLDGGAGTDTLVINDTTPVYAAINAAKNFEVLGLNATGATVDVSQITNGISQFAVGSGTLTETFSNALSTSKFTIDNTAGNTGTVSIANKVGETGTAITLDNQGAASQSLAALKLTGVTNVALASTGKAGNVITLLNNADNSNITVTGSADLTLALKASGIAGVGSKVDGSAATGALTLTGNTVAFTTGSSLGDTLIGGSKADVLKASVNGGTLTGNGGNDTFDVTVAKAGAATGYAVTTITDFTKGDILKLDAASTAITKVDLSTATSVDVALAALTAGTTAHASWGTYGGNTYVVSADTTAGVSATDTIVKLAGVLDLSTSTVATGAVTFA